jgi:nitrogen fixation-related uncharacterized protein
VAVKTGQYDDDYTPSVRILFDDELIQSNGGKVKGKSPKLSIVPKTTNQINKPI